MVALILLVGCLLRILFLSDSAIEHFDEGVYASNLWFSAEQGAEYPGRFYYAPPLFPFLIEWSMIFLGSGPLGVFLPSLLFGILTVLLIWWVAREWFGPAAGLVALALGLEAVMKARMFLKVLNTSVHRFEIQGGALHLNQFDATPHLDLPARHSARTHY